MIIFHEGLPGSGKSYEACIEWIIPSLKAGRRVFAYIEGLNHEKFAICAGLPLARVQSLLVQLSVDDIPRLPDVVEKDSLVIVDEAQDFWPAQRQPLSPELTTFVTQHRHEGLDIVLMGQDLRDVHNLWKRRVEQKVIFVKLSAVGMTGRYKWEVHRATKGEKFIKVNSGTKSYDPDYFGLYASHSAGTTNTATLQDSRAVLWRTPAFKWGVPLVLIAVVFAIRHLVAFFSVDEPAPVVESAPSVTPAHEQPRVDPVPAPVPATPSVDEESSLLADPGQYLEEVLRGNRLRLAAVIESAEGDRRSALFEVLDSGFHQKEVLTIPQLVALGWQVQRQVYGFDVYRDTDQRYVVTSWPIDPFGRTSKTTRSDPTVSTGAR